VTRKAKFSWGKKSFKNHYEHFFFRLRPWVKNHYNLVKKRKFNAIKTIDNLMPSAELAIFSKSSGWLQRFFVQNPKCMHFFSMQILKAYSGSCRVLGFSIWLKNLLLLPLRFTSALVESSIWTFTLASEGPSIIKFNSFSQF